MTDEKTISDEVGTKLLFENDRVRVWDLCLVPGQSTGLHRHSDDYFYVVIGGGTLQAANAEGEHGEAHKMEDGEVRFRAIEGGEAAIHEAINAGDAPWRNIVVELKR